jgi:predicted MPP superfamily phosphohydrolase
MIRIIHISDLHLEQEVPSYEKAAIIKALASDLKKQINENTILFLTGDLVDRGAFNFADKSNAFFTFEKVFIEPILNQNPSLRGKIFFVPGNHDVYREKIDKYSESGLKSELDSVEGIDAFIRSNRLKSKHLDRLEEYKNGNVIFIQDITQKNQPTLNFSYKLNIGRYRVGITCLNSSWLCKDDLDKEIFYLGKIKLRILSLK